MRAFAISGGNPGVLPAHPVPIGCHKVVRACCEVRGPSAGFRYRQYPLDETAARCDLRSKAELAIDHRLGLRSRFVSCCHYYVEGGQSSFEMTSKIFCQPCRDAIPSRLTLYRSVSECHVLMVAIDWLTNFAVRCVALRKADHTILNFDRPSEAARRLPEMAHQQSREVGTSFGRAFTSQPMRYSAGFGQPFDDRIAVGKERAAVRAFGHRTIDGPAFYTSVSSDSFLWRADVGC